MKGELEKRQSEVIAAMRFPLMVLLLFAHVLPMVSVPIEMNLSEMNIYHFISEGISHNLSRIRNPLFFFFSGFFFFRKLEEWNAGFYRSQLQKRIRSLLLPYLLWNILMIAAIYIKNYAVTSFLSMEPGEERFTLYVRIGPSFLSVFQVSERIRCTDTGDSVFVRLGNGCCGTEYVGYHVLWGRCLYGDLQKEHSGVLFQVSLYGGDSHSFVFVLCHDV